jgi:hypothetical protein
LIGHVQTPLLACRRCALLSAKTWREAFQKAKAQSAPQWRRVLVRIELASHFVGFDNDQIAMITAANIPHTITNALMICSSSETDIASGGARGAKHMRESIECHKT